MAVQTYNGAVDRGLEGVIACTTDISYIIDANLTFRGYTIEDLAKNSSFEEVVFLLWNNKLPSKGELDQFSTQISSNLGLSQDQLNAIKVLPTKGVHPMAWLRSAVSMLALWDEDSQDSSPEAVSRVAMKLVGKMGGLVAYFERLRQGKDYIAPKSGQSVAWNFLYQLNGEEPDADMVKVMDTCLILHADHELNCSAFASRVTASSLSDVYSAVVSAIGALKGPLHGGANEQVMRTLKKIGTVENAKDWIAKALENKEKIMGIGHRVYKNGDPRAKILKGMSEMMTKKAGESQWFEMSKVIEDTVREAKGLLPNVDFYSATVYYSMGIPLDLYTPIFATSRVSGWLAHIQEQYSKNRIYRPRGEWTGKSGLTWTSMDQR